MEAKICVPARLARRAAKLEGRRPHSHGGYQSENRKKINRAEQSAQTGASPRHVRLDRRGDLCAIAALQRIDVDEMLAHRSNVALLLIPLVPLVVIVEDHRDDIVEADDEAIVRRVVDEPVKPLVKLRKLAEAGLRFLQEVEMLLPDIIQGSPSRIARRQREKPLR